MVVVGCESRGRAADSGAGDVGDEAVVGVGYGTQDWGDGVGG